ncbi:hypothetical protein ACFWN5_36955 [Streptomyces sp. NPDC058430]|uniref:hypothetical protein n=1 Tax=Streptomyces sp. NPDC058430 TaxID=3346495 RepID=UPI0036668B67
MAQHNPYRVPAELVGEFMPVQIAAWQNGYDRLPALTGDRPESHPRQGMAGVPLDVDGD